MASHSALTQPASAHCAAAEAAAGVIVMAVFKLRLACSSGSRIAHPVTDDLPL
jgi:hypothetical protein